MIMSVFDNPKELADDIVLWAMNDRDFYFKNIKPIVLNYARKKVNGTYSREMAIKGINLHLIKDAMAMYARDVGVPVSLTKKYREYAAKELLESIEEWINDVVKEMRALKKAGKPWTMRNR